jgi:TPR repeat protein
MKNRLNVLKSFAVALFALSMASNAWAVGPPVFETPDHKAVNGAVHALKKGFEKDAFDKFERASLYGNKHAQTSVAMMYLKGVGVSKDWVVGYAWLTLAASLGDPETTRARDDVYAQLTDEEKSRTKQQIDHLNETYSDQLALERREEWVRKQKREVTGSRTGSTAGLELQVGDANGHTWQIAGTKYFELLEGSYVMEFRQHLGEVEIGELTLVDEN